MEAEALEEVEAAIEAIVRPLKQPVELLPRAPEVRVWPGGAPAPSTRGEGHA